MKKKITKTFLTLYAAFTVLMCSSSLATAAVASPDSTNHVHDFEYVHVATREDDAGTHQYIWGYDPDENPIYHYDCRLTNIVWIRVPQCTICGLQHGDPYESVVYIKHSIDHK